ncbi:MAG: twin-arginine translocation signal domain-containing protein [Acidobacteria bacterium]|nr:twin-arginine translocation signal domain-containing protein [Acidobacteriota bacterium]
MPESEKLSVDRRNFLRMAATGAAALVTSAQEGRAEKSGSPGPETPPEMPKDVEILTTDRPGSDFMVDVLKSLGLEYICSNPGSSFRGLHESVVNYGGNKNPEFITCCHEESSVAMAHGYAKIEGKPLGVFAHGTVGLQHAAMAIYNAFCDRVPVYLILGNTLDAEMRRPGAEWYHSVQDAAAMVRDYVKWDDTPISLPHFAESAMRAYKIAMTPPMLPVVLVADSELQERPIPEGVRLRIPKLVLAAPPQGDSGAVAEAARLLVAAENPVLIADRVARTPAGMKYLVELAEALQAPVIDEGGRMNFPTRHPLNHSDRRGALITSADLILGLELGDFWGAVNSMRDQLHRTWRPITKQGVKLISITAADLYTRSNYQDFQRFPEVDLAIAADAEATLPSLIEAVKRLINADRKRAFQDRGTKLAAARQQSMERTRTEATYGWDAGPVSTARLAAEVWPHIKDKDWSLVSGTLSGWPRRLWIFDKHYQHIGGSGGVGVGYGSPAAVGAALANRKYGRLSVNFQNDGDLMYAPGVLWTAAHHRVPLLNIMFNNRAYHQEVMHLQRMSSRHNRGITTAYIGTTIEDPNIDYAKLAQSMGWHAEGPITDPKDLAPAIRRSVELVLRGEPALIDVVTQPR